MNNPKFPLKIYPFQSMLYGTLPKGCKLCHEGLKSVIFITGVCNGRCFYCPLSTKRRAKDVLYTNENLITQNFTRDDLTKIIKEIEVSGSTGASLTGGDPLIKPERTLLIAKKLKNAFGDKFHIHLYTLGRNNPQFFSKLSKYIDEIRFHLRSSKDLAGLNIATKYSWDIGLEIPGLPNFSDNEWTLKGLNIIKDRKNAFININELEYSETNYENIITHGIRFNKNGRLPNFPNYVKKNLFNLHQTYPNLTLHFCSVFQKDQVQIPKRILRRAYNVAYPFDIIMEDNKYTGLLMRGEIKVDPEKVETTHNNYLNAVTDFLITDLDLKRYNDFVFEQNHNRILISPLFLEETEGVKKILRNFPNLKIGQLLEYPTADRLRAMYIPIES